VNERQLASRESVAHKATENDVTLRFLDFVLEVFVSSEWADLLLNPWGKQVAVDVRLADLFPNPALK